MSTIRLRPYSLRWPALFEQEAEDLRARLGPWLAGAIEHVGSTAVPGLAAKPILDMLAPVHDLREARAAAPELAALGYRREDHRPQEALWFYKQPGEDYQVRTHQLHLTRTDSDLWRERVAFRDALRADPALLREYQALKHNLSSALDLAEYTRGKRAFVATVLKAAGVDLA